MFAESEISGKHLICDVKSIHNTELLNDAEKLQGMMDTICGKYGFAVLHRCRHQFEPFGCTILFLLSESHFSIHTYPEKQYAAVDLYTCRTTETADKELREIYDYIIGELNAAQDETPVMILNRRF
jgi:S-adenosylmethionine decarboxylase